MEVIISDIQGKANPQDEANPQDDFVVWGKNFTGTWWTPEKSFLKDKRKWFEAR